MRTRTIGRLACLFAAAALSASATADAAVICQKGKRVTLRPGPGCKKKEQKVVDTTSFALGSQVTAVESGADGRLDALEQGVGRIAALEKDVGLQCVGAPSRTFAMKFAQTSAELLSTPELRTSGCRALDGRPQDCNNAFQSGLGYDSAYIEATSCFYHAGRCFACSFEWIRDGACVNDCGPPACPNAPTRTFRGGEMTCATITQQGACEAAFVGGGEGEEEGRTCYWDAGGNVCRICSLDDEIDGKCTNGCFPLYTCSARAGKPVKACTAVVGQGACEAAFQVTSQNAQPYPASCFFDGACKVCSVARQFRDRTCTNACN